MIDTRSVASVVVLKTGEYSLRSSSAQSPRRNRKEALVSNDRQIRPTSAQSPIRNRKDVPIADSYDIVCVPMLFRSIPIPSILPGHWTKPYLGEIFG